MVLTIVAMGFVTLIYAISQRCNVDMRSGDKTLKCSPSNNNDQTDEK